MSLLMQLMNGLTVYISVLIIFRLINYFFMNLYNITNFIKYLNCLENFNDFARLNSPERRVTQGMSLLFMAWWPDIYPHQAQHGFKSSLTRTTVCVWSVRVTLYFYKCGCTRMSTNTNTLIHIIHNYIPLPQPNSIQPNLNLAPSQLNLDHN